MSKTIALLTDFGSNDVYVGVMKGVMRRINPAAQFIDVTHAIRPQSVRGGALALRNSYAYFPEDTIFLVIVDPAVGSKRRPILVRAANYQFIAPDNGVLSYALADFDTFKAVELSNEAYRLSDVSNTFHGRDVFAPAAAYASRGDMSLEDFGDLVDDLFVLPEPDLQVSLGNITGEITHIDHFGNIITSIGKLHWVSPARLTLRGGGKNVRIVADDATVSLNGESIYGVSSAYHELPRGALLAQVDSNGYLEVAINQGNAAERLGAAIGDIVELAYKSQTGMLA